VDVQRARPAGIAASPVFEPTPYVNNTIRMFDHLRGRLGFDVELIHDVHERVPPAQAIQLAKALEPFRLFFLEECFAPEDAAWFQHLRVQTSTPLAMGELFVNRHEWLWRPSDLRSVAPSVTIEMSVGGGVCLRRGAAR
jgi:mannonate dehydratase